MLLNLFVFSQHVWHFVNVTTPVQSKFECQIANAFENSCIFVDSTGNNITGFNATQNYLFGMKLTDDATFNMIYTLTCMLRQCSKPPCSRCLFQISATDIAKPNVIISNYQSVIGQFNISVQSTTLLFQIAFF